MRQYCLLLFLATISVFWGCKPEKTVVEEPDIESLRKEVKPTEITIANATYRPFEFLINSSGVIVSETEVRVAFQGSGYLEQLQVRNGQRVKKGQVLGRLEHTREKLAVEKAKINLANAQVKYSSDSMAYGSNFSQTIQRNLELQSGLSAAKISLAEAQVNLEHTVIQAPVPGVVASLEEKQGNLVSSGKELCVIYDPDHLTLTGKVLETDFKHIKTGLQADIYPLAFKNQQFEALLTEIDPKVDDKGMIAIKFRLLRPQGLLPGMNANAVIRVPQNHNIIVPREALVIKSGRPVVFTYENGLAKWNYVEVGLDNGTDIEILDGIKEGSAVIVSNNLQLGHDARVSISNEPLVEGK